MCDLHNCDLDTGWVVLPVVYSNRQGGRERSIRPCACVWVWAKLFLRR